MILAGWQAKIRRGVHQLREGKVAGLFPIIYRVLAPSKRWLALGFLNHQQYFKDNIENPIVNVTFVAMWMETC